MKKGSLVVAFDDVSLQLGDTGIARYWRELANNLVSLEIFEEIGIRPIFLSRSKFRTPKVNNHIEFPQFDFRFPAADRQLISALCESEGVDLFVSSYYTFSTVTANLMLIYDLIPEVIGFNRMNRGWMERELAIYSASSYFTISQNSKRDLEKFFPHTSQLDIGVGYPGIDSNLFKNSESTTVKQGRQRPYFVCIGSRYGEGGYKNGKLLVDAIESMDASKVNFDLHFIGGEALTTEESALQVSKGVKIHTGRLSDTELVGVLKGAQALIYPSKYEGFGMPPLEALSLGTPVITTGCASIPEAVGDLAVFIDPDNPRQLADLLVNGDFKEMRESLAISGPVRAQSFSWETTAREFGRTLKRALTNSQTPQWRERQKILHEYSQIAVNLQY